MDGGVVGIDKVLVVEDENGHKTYTFPLKRTFPTTKIENLVLKRNTDSTFSGVLIQYDVSATDKDLFSNWHSVDLKTKTKIYNINNLSIASQARVQTSYFGCFSMSYEDGMCGEDQHSYGDTSCTFTPTNQPGKQAQPPRILSITAVPGCGNGGGDGTTGSSPATGSFPAGGGEGLTMLFDEYDLTYHNGDITDPAFQFWSKVNQFVQTQPQNVQNLNAEYHYVFYFIHQYFQLNGGLTVPNKTFAADRLQKIATWLYDTSMGTHLDYEQKRNIAIWSVKYLLENPDMTWEDFKNQFLMNPCENIMDGNQKAKEYLLKPKAAGRLSEIKTGIATQAKEKSFSFGVDSNGTEQVTSIKESFSGNSVGIVASSPSFTIKGGIHTHSPGGASPPSASDIYTFMQGYTANNNFTFYYTVTYDGNEYVFTITDYTKFKKFAKEYPQDEYVDHELNSWINGKSIGDEFYKASQYFKKKQGKSKNESFELAMAYVLKKFNTGVGMSKKDANGDFKPIFINEQQDPANPKKKTYNKTDNCNL